MWSQVEKRAKKSFNLVCLRGDVVYLGRNSLLMGPALMPNRFTVELGKTANMKRAIQEFIVSALAWRIWLAMSLTDIQMQYRRSVLGPFWLALNFLFTLSSIGFVFSFVFKVDYTNFIPYVASGLLVWNLLSAFINEGAKSFTQHAIAIRNINLPPTFYAFRTTTTQIIVAAHNLLVLLVVFIVFPKNTTPLAILAVPGFILYAINGLAIAIILGFVCARFRDVANIVINVMQAIMFITPIFWPATNLSGSILIEANPFYHYIEITRAPLLGDLPTGLTLIVVAAITLLLWIMALFVYVRLRWQIIHTV